MAEEPKQPSQGQQVENILQKKKALILQDKQLEKPSLTPTVSEDDFGVVTIQVRIPGFAPALRQRATERRVGDKDSRDRVTYQDEDPRDRIRYTDPDPTDPPYHP